MTVRDLSGSILKFKKDYRHIADGAEDCDLLADFQQLGTWEHLLLSPAEY
jgi:hypothetical protein